MSKDFVDYELTNPPENGNAFSRWQADFDLVVLSKLQALLEGQERVTHLWTWAKVSLGMCSGISVVLGVLFMWKRILT